MNFGEQGKEYYELNICILQIPIFVTPKMILWELGHYRSNWIWLQSQGKVIPVFFSHCVRAHKKMSN